MDGSALSWRINEYWRVGAGLIARQWGPAWDGSLILSPAARPFPSVSVDADSDSLSQSKWWWWLGQVQLGGFVGQLESDRDDVPKPYLIGMRLVLRPWDWLELGLSRTMQLGGEGRDNSLKTFLKAFLGRDNSCYQTGCSEQPEPARRVRRTPEPRCMSSRGGAVRADHRRGRPVRCGQRAGQEYVPGRRRVAPRRCAGLRRVDRFHSQGRPTSLTTTSSTPTAIATRGARSGTGPMATRTCGRSAVC